MSEQLHDNLNTVPNEGEDSFDALLMNALPPEADPAVSRRLMPGKQAMSLLLISMGTGMFTFNFLGLNFLLPLISMVLSLVGWYRLKDANRAFARGWRIRLIRFPLLCLLLFSSLSIYNQYLLGFFFPALYFGLTILNWVLALAELGALREGIAQVQKKAGQSQDTAAVTVLMVIQVITAILSFSGLLALILIIVIVVFFIKLCRLAASLREAGYAMEGKPVRIRPLVLGIACGAFLVLGCLLSFLFLSRYPMEWEAREDALSAEATALATDLKAMGFPEEALRDLREEDILSCRGALSVLRYETQVYSNGLEGMTLRGVAVVLSEKPRIWRIFYHFSLPDQEGYWGSEALEIRPSQLFSKDGGILRDEPQGWILREGETGSLIAPIPSVTKLHYSIRSDALFGNGTGWNGDTWFASFSLPRSFKGARGYVSLTVEDMYGEIDFAWGDNAKQLIQQRYMQGMFYIHQKRAWQMPVFSAMESKVLGGPGGFFGPAFESVNLPGCFWVD